MNNNITAKEVAVAEDELGEVRGSCVSAAAQWRGLLVGDNAYAVIAKTKGIS